RATMAWARRASAGQRSPVSARRTPATYSSIGNSLITARPLPWRMISSGATYSRPLSRSERSLVSRKAAAARPSISTAVAVAVARTTSTRHGTPGQRGHPTPSGVTSMSKPTMTRARPTSDMASLEETALPALRGGRLPLQMQVCLTGHPPTRRRAHDEADLQEIGLHHLRERLGLVVDRGRDGLDADGTPAVVLDDGGQESPVEPIETSAVHAFLVERVTSDGGRDDPVAGHVGVVADP